jgi:hypothetical protein
MTRLEDINVTTNQAVVNAVHTLLHPLSNPINHGEFNRRMFLEAIAVKAGHGCSMTAEDIINYACMTGKEFTVIKDEYVSQGVIKETPNVFGMVLYSMNV